MLEARGVSLQYFDQGRPVFACQGIDLAIQPGEFLGILGPSGSGKSSLLYLLSGLKVPTDGRVTYRGQPISDWDDDARSRLRLSDFGFVFQQPYLLGYLSARENVLVAQPESGHPDHADHLLAELGLAEKRHRLPHELSGGERQRVCVARALYGSPKVVFADEPTAALDHRNGVGVVELLNQLRGDGSLVMVTHDPSMLADATRVVRLIDGHLESG